MADTGGASTGRTIPTTMGWLREGMNGLVVLASGVLTFGAGLYKDLGLGSQVQEVFFALSAVGLLVTIVCGVLCSFWLNRYVNLRETDITPQRHIETGVAEAAEKRVMPADMQRARGRYYFFYYATLIGFCLSMALITVLLLVSVFHAASPATSKKDCQPCTVNVQPTATPVSRYNITTSARHAGRRGILIQHTFLVDQATGQVWQMFCRKGSEEVEFRKVHVEAIPEAEASKR